MLRFEQQNNVCNSSSQKIQYQIISMGLIPMISLERIWFGSLVGPGLKTHPCADLVTNSHSISGKVKLCLQRNSGINPFSKSPFLVMSDLRLKIHGRKISPVDFQPQNYVIFSAPHWRGLNLTPSRYSRQLNRQLIRTMKFPGIVLTV